MPEKKDFATTGTESFELSEKKLASAEAKPVILNIQEEESVGTVLENLDKRNSNNPIFAIYNKLNVYFASKAKVKLKEKATFFHLLSVMINAGVPMIKALYSLIAQLDKSPRLQIVISELAKGIEEGNSLSAGMLLYPRVFAESEVGMVQSGEISGQLSRVLENLANDAEKSNEIRHKVKSAMMYPIVIFSLLIIVIIGMMVFVVPKLKELFAANEAELPLISKVVIGTSDFVVNNIVLVLTTAVAAYVIFSLLKRTEAGRYNVDRIKINIPVFGNLLRKAYLSRFARSLNNLLDSNVSIVKTLEITANSIGNEVYRRKLLMSIEDIKQGIPLAENLTSSDLFPPMLVNMIDIGEKTAQLSEITGKIAAFYENEVDTSVSGISKIIEPIILIIIGVTVGTVVAAVMLPIIKLTDLAGTL